MLSCWQTGCRKMLIFGTLLFRQCQHSLWVFSGFSSFICCLTVNSHTRFCLLSSLWPLRLSLLRMNVRVFIMHYWAKLLQSVAIALGCNQWCWKYYSLKKQMWLQIFQAFRLWLVTCEVQWSAGAQGQNDSVQVKFSLSWQLVIKQNQVHGASL